jgi:hypothetical protein
MTKAFTFFAVLALTMIITAAFFGVPGPSVLQAQEEQRAEVSDAGANCRLVEVALDEGYGISRRVVRTDCSTIQ